MGACIPKQKPPTPLSVDNLLSMQENLEIGTMEADEKLRACLDHALREFPHEPRCLQDNATLIIQVRGRKRMEFVSGAGENKIVVSWLRRKTQYNVEIPNLEVYLGRLSLLPAPLTSENLVKVRQELIRWDDATKELCACLDVAINELEREPPSVKRDAELTVECSNSCLTFISGKRRSHVHILFSDRHPRYQVRVSSIDVYLDRLSCRPTPLSAENLLKVWKETENLKGCTVDLRACLKRALQEFNALSPRHRANATIFIDCDGKNFKMVSGHGESWISVFNIVGDQHCRREVVLALGEIGMSSRVTGSNSGKGGKEGPSFRVRRSEGRSSAEEGPSSQAKRTSNGSKGLSHGKKAKRGPSNVAELEVFASSSRKGEEETTLLVERTFCSGRRADTGLPNCSKTLVRERSLRSMVLSASQRGKLSDGNKEQEREPAGSLGTPGGTATKEASIQGRCQETGKEREAASGSSEEEAPPDVLEESSESKQADDGPER